MTNIKTCFVISPIGDAESPDRNRSDNVLKYIIRPAAEQCGYSVIRADEISKPGIITADIFQHIFDDEIVIADLTDHNPNVFYELAVRHASGKPVVQIILSGRSIPFDIAQSRTIQFKHTDLESAYNCRQEIVKQIQAIESNPDDFDNPINMTRILLDARRSDNPIEKSYAEIIAMLKDIKAEIEDLSLKHVTTPSQQKKISSMIREFLQNQFEDLEDKLIDIELELGNLQKRDLNEMLYEGESVQQRMAELRHERSNLLQEKSAILANLEG